MNPVVLSGYFGAQNFGDEAMLEYLVQFLQSHGHGAPCALSINPEETHRRHRTSGADSRSLRRKLAALRHSRLLVFGGGELVKNYWPDGGSVVGRALIDVALATALGVPVVVLEVGSEELRNPVGRRYARDILSLAEAVWVRDPTSMHRLSSIGVPQASMKQGADLLFGLDPTISAEDLRPNNGSGPVVALSLPDAELREALLEAPGRYQAFFHNLAFGVGQLVPQAAGKLVLLGFEANDEANDLNLLDHLARGCPMASPPERVGLAGETIASALSTFHRLDFLVGMRFHSIVLAALAGTPFLALSLEDKVKKLAADLEIQDWCFDTAVDPPESLPERLHQAWETRTQLLERLEPGKDRLHRAARAGEKDLLATLARPPRIPLGRRVKALRILAPLLAEAGLRRPSRRGVPPRPWAALRWDSTLKHLPPVRVMA